MGFLRQMSTVIAPSRMRAEGNGTLQRYVNAFWSGDALPTINAGASSQSELALALTHVYCAVDTISADFGSMTCQLFEDMGAKGRRRVEYSDPGIGSLAQKLRWYPNQWQTAKAFWSTLAWQYQLRPAAYAEIIYRPGLTGFVDQVVPRHPDRVTQETLPSGAVRFRLRERNGATRYITSNEMFVVRNTSMDGINALGRLDYGAQAIDGALALQEFSKNYFRKGATAALMATYKGASMEAEDEAALHGSITRYLSGVENAGGLLLVPEDIDVKTLGVDPEKAQLLGLKNISGRDVARMFKMPPSWLGIEGATSYSSQVQDATNYVNRCQMPMVIEFEQAIQRDLIVVATKYFAKYNMDYLLRADTLARAQAYEIFIKSRVMRPSEARVKEDLSPDERLDQLSEGDFRPGAAAAGSAPNVDPTEAPSRSSGRAAARGTLALHDAAVRCCRRERAACERLAKKHASDVDGWQSALREFYGDHAGFIAETMRVSADQARGYAARHGADLEKHGVVVQTDDWERAEAMALMDVALDGVPA